MHMPRTPKILPLVMYTETSASLEQNTAISQNREYCLNTELEVKLEQTTEDKKKVTENILDNCDCLAVSPCHILKPASMVHHHI